MRFSIPLRCSVVRSESDGIASKQVRLVQESMTIISYFHKDEISPLHYVTVVRSNSDGIASQQMRLGRASMTIPSQASKFYIWSLRA
jgi:hypothetical protein